MKKYCVGLDVGGTNLKAGLLSTRGKLLDQFVMPLIDKDKTEAGMVKAAERTSRQLLKRSNLEVEDLVGIGIGIAGVIDGRQGIITQSPQFPLWKNFALSGKLSSRLGLPVVMENDVNAIGRGEQWVGAVRGENNFIGLAIGTGLGGVICLDGKIWSGVDGMAGELGHITVEPNGPQCNCGTKGCLESFASSTALVREVKKDRYKPVLSRIEKDSQIPFTLAQLAHEGDKKAQAYWDKVGWAIGVALGGLLNALNVKVVFFGGGLSHSFDLFRPALEKELPRRAFPAVVRGVEFRVSELWDDAGVYGAASLLLQSVSASRKKYKG